MSLRVDEARTFRERALALAEAGDEGALASLVVLSCSLAAAHGVSGIPVGLAGLQPERSPADDCAEGKGRGVGQDLSDAAVTTKVKAKLAADSDVASRNIHVETDAGVVTLKGEVRNRHEATKAVQDTLSTGGVFAVDSQLRWSVAEAAPGSPQM